MAQDTPEGHAEEAAAPQGHQPPDAPADESQILHEFLEALASSQYRILDLGKLSSVRDESQMLNDADLEHMKAAHALRNAQGAQAQLSNLVVSGRFGREDLVYKHLFDGWLALYDRLLVKESIESLDSWGPTPDNQAERNGFAEPELHHDDETLNKVRSALQGLGFSRATANDAINAMHGNGILFRERQPVSDEDPTEVIPFTK